MKSLTAIAKYRIPTTVCLAGLIWVSAISISAHAGTFYVDFTQGTPAGDGSAASPWDTITTALDNVPDDSLVLVRSGTYTGRVRLRGTFPNGVTVKAEQDYQVRLRNSDRVITAYEHASGCNGIILEGFDIAHTGPGAGALVIHIEGNGDNSVSNLVLRNNIIHDSYNNDLLKINNAATNIRVEGNIFYNQSGSDEHIDINSIDNVVVRGNVFFNDFAGSGRTIDNDTSSFIVVKDSNAASDIYTGSRQVTICRNVFLNWQGSTGNNFVLIGEDGKSYFEAFDVMVENNLMLGNALNPMRAAFGVKGGQGITFRNNTVVGDLPANAYAMRLNTEGSNPPNETVGFYNNIWSDTTGTMGAAASGGANDFSDTPPAETVSFTLSGNLYFNGAQPIPSDSSELVNYTDDAHRIVADPLLPSQSGIVLPRWQAGTGQFADGSASINEVFRRLVVNYGRPGSDSPAIDAALTAHAPVEDILGHIRTTTPDIGAFETVSLTDLIVRLQVLAGVNPDTLNTNRHVTADNRIDPAEAIYLLQIIAEIR